MTTSEAGTGVVREPFGTLADGTPVDRYVLGSGQEGLQVAVLTYGGAVQELWAPDRDGERADVVLGFASPAGYEARENPYLGALVGRYANRIAGGRFDLNGRTYALEPNNGPNTLHGGAEGFDRRVWSAEVPDGDRPALRLRLVSPDGDQGFPARLAVTVTYTVDEDRLRLDWVATNEEEPGGPSTVVNLTNHSYFNLRGEGTGSVEDHRLRLLAGRYVPVDGTAIPTGELAAVEGTPMDFRTATPIGARVREAHEQLLVGQGYDHCWVLDGDLPADLPRTGTEPSGLALAAVVDEPVSGRVLETWTDQPGVQCYSGNFLDGTLVGKRGRTYRQGDGFCLETQHFPDSPNRPGFPSTVLAPQETFRTTTVWRLRTS
jgi:aldose 1-epimerase